MIDRRTVLLGALFVPIAGTARAQAPRFADLQRHLGPGGRLGVAAINLGSGARTGFGQDQRFAMASTFKLALAGAVLAQVDARRLALSDRLTVRPADLVGHAPVSQRAGAGAALSLATLCAAAVSDSDNGAANLLLDRIGGPEAMTRFFRRCGDRHSRLDRREPELNSNLPRDPRDTTRPAAMLVTMRVLLASPLLRPASRAVLTEWLVASTRGLDRLRGGLPSGWRVGSKAGTGARGANNDLGIAWPRRGGPILIASYIDAPNVAEAARAEVHRQVARRIAAALA